MIIQYFGAQWCKPCSEVKPYVMEVSKKYGISIELFDYDDLSDEAKEKITKLPTIQIWDDKEQIYEITKNHKQSLDSWILENVRVIPDEDF